MLESLTIERLDRWSGLQASSDSRLKSKLQTPQPASITICLVDFILELRQDSSPIDFLSRRGQTLQMSVYVVFCIVERENSRWLASTHLLT